MRVVRITEEDKISLLNRRGTIKFQTKICGSVAADRVATAAGRCTAAVIARPLPFAISGLGDSKKLNALSRPGPSRTWTKIKNPKSAAATRAMEGTF
jgi:hypothetical protein